MSYSCGMWARPSTLFDRQFEWEVLAQHAGGGQEGASLGLVYGRRRQGKTLLLELLCEAAGGLVVTGLEQSAAQNRAAIGAAYARHRGVGAPVAFGGWAEAIDGLLALGEDRPHPVPVVLDEFPYLLATAPELPSIIQAALSPRGRAKRRSRTRLILCGSAFSIMEGLLGGTAPLRGRASTELLIHPFDYRTAAGFWDVAGEWPLAVRLHALVGGTPAYRSYAAGKRPASVGQLGRWATAHLLNPASAFFREGRVLLAEEMGTGDPALYLSLLAAMAGGATRRGQIAAALGRKETALAHPLRTLEDTRLITRVVNPLHERRSTYRIAEPMIRTHQLLIAPNETRLTRHRAPAVWADAQPTLESNIYGPHLEDLAREWTALHAAPGTLGGSAAQTVGSAEVPCRQHRGHQVDVVATSGDEVIALGEAKWRAVTAGDVDRLRHIREVTPNAGGARLLLFTAGTPKVPPGEARHAEIIDLERLYTGT
jgi:AAA+ ATPase superfamily predicted ATPase